MQTQLPDILTLWLVLPATWLPLAAFGLILVLFRDRPALSASVSIGAMSISFFSAMALLVIHWQMEMPIQFAFRWLSSGDMTIPVGFLLDPTSLLMMGIVTGIALLVQIYSIGYMAGDPGFARYYALMSLFAWAMINLSLSPNLLQLYIFWELVGVSSYLLIGFWYEKFSASEAGKKAFVMTRVGDVAFFLGLLLALIHTGTLDILTLCGPDTAEKMTPHLITLSALLIFGGIVGKSAQFPLLTWLPDAMEGPTPVSALLHSATMVAAGVFLFARLFPFFSLSPSAMTLFLAIGTISMLMASTMAMVARDIKQVWAFSTISQLGFMIMGLAAGSYFAGVFHLTTHAGFKALLFLCAGVFIHTFGSNDMYEIGRMGGRRLKMPMTCMVIAAAALSGLPPLSGFFSKELILGALAELPNPLWLWAGLIGAFLTAYYTFRLIFIVLFPGTGVKVDPDAASHVHDGHHGHSGYGAMAFPLMVLALLTLLLGFGQGLLAQFLGEGVHAVPDPAMAAHPWLLFTAVGLGVGGVLLAWFEFGRPRAARVGFVERYVFLKALFENRWYLDRLYRWILDNIVYGGFSRLCARGDRDLIDRAIDGLGGGAVGAGGLLSRMHTSMIQYRLMVMFVVMALLALYFFFGEP